MIIDIATDCQVVIANQTNLSDEDEYRVYVDIEFIDINDEQQMIINITLWTNDESFFNSMKEYVQSDEFIEDLISSVIAYLVFLSKLSLHILLQIIMFQWKWRIAIRI